MLLFGKYNWSLFQALSGAHYCLPVVHCSGCYLFSSNFWWRYDQKTWWHRTTVIHIELHTETMDPERGSMTRIRPSRDVVAKRLPFRFHARERIRSLWTSTTWAACTVLMFQTIHCSGSSLMLLCCSIISASNIYIKFSLLYEFNFWWASAVDDAVNVHAIPAKKLHLLKAFCLYVTSCINLLHYGLRQAEIFMPPPPIDAAEALCFRVARPWMHACVRSGVHPVDTISYKPMTEFHKTLVICVPEATDEPITFWRLWGQGQGRYWVSYCGGWSHLHRRLDGHRSVIYTTGCSKKRKLRLPPHLYSAMPLPSKTHTTANINATFSNV